MLFAPVLTPSLKKQLLLLLLLLFLLLTLFKLQLYVMSLIKGDTLDLRVFVLIGEETLLVDSMFGVELILTGKLLCDELLTFVKLFSVVFVVTDVLFVIPELTAKLVLLMLFNCVKDATYSLFLLPVIELFTAAMLLFLFLLTLLQLFILLVILLLLFWLLLQFKAAVRLLLSCSLPSTM